MLHGHCHQKALLGVSASAPALRLVPGLRVQVLDSGCCGMAGSFGFEREHYDLSVKIANLALVPALTAGLSATVYTQLCDVEDEVNGLLTYDREVLKIDEDVVRGAVERLRAVFSAACGA